MNRIVIVTGATSGYGLATARKFKENGDVVIAVSRNAQKVDEVVKSLGLADGFTMDVKDFESWKALKDFVIGKYGRVDVLVNNAGGGVKIADVEEHTRETIDETIALNLNSVIYSANVFAPVLKAQKEGTVVNIASVCATHCWGSWSVYAAAKAGVLNFTKGLYVELQPYGARATCVIPAAANTGFQKNAGMAEGDRQTLLPENIADAVYYVADQPKGVVVEDMTVWGTSQVVQPL